MLYVLYAFMALTLLSLLWGLSYFVRSSDRARVQSNKMMQMRVVFQAAALLVFAYLMMR